jgi:hypothetical protein
LAAHFLKAGVIKITPVSLIYFKLFMADLKLGTIDDASDKFHWIVGNMTILGDGFLTRVKDFFPTGDFTEQVLRVLLRSTGIRVNQEEQLT